MTRFISYRYCGILGNNLQTDGVSTCFGAIFTENDFHRENISFTETRQYFYIDAICNTKIALYSSNGAYTYTLPQSKAVQITGKDGSRNHVSFVHPQYGKMTATVNSADLKFISGDKWHKIRRSSGETGWVFSKYVTMQY
jgi:hypothetical protein